jgi:GST-like protein
MIDLYYWPTPNGHKITMFLEEVALDYTIHPVNISAGDQFKPEFLAVSPNNRMPAIIDRAPADGGEPVTVFESGAILLYLAEKTVHFLPADLRGRSASSRISTTSSMFAAGSTASGNGRPPCGPTPEANSIPRCRP